MSEETRKKAKSVTIIWEEGEDETLTCGDRGDIFVVLASEKDDHYTSLWSGGMALFEALMASAVELRARLHVGHIHNEDRRMVERFIEDALGQKSD